MNTELYNQLVKADAVCKKAYPYMEKADELEALGNSKLSYKTWYLKLISVVIGFLIADGILLIRVPLYIHIAIGIGVGAAGFFGLPALRKQLALKAAQPYYDRANEQIALAQQVFNENHDDVSILPEEYWYPLASEYIARMVQTERAHTVPEALSLFDEQLHRWTMENTQQEILAQQQAQTAHLRSIRRSSAVSAGANVANAIGNIASRL